MHYLHFHQAHHAVRIERTKALKGPLTREYSFETRTEKKE